MATKNSKWRKLDNAATAFPAVTDQNDSRVFRIYCQLKDNVQPDILQAALEKTIKKYPLYQAVLRKGLFWFYLEQREILPKVVKEERPPCSIIYIPDQKKLLFEVSYDGNRINFEVFHALTDGTGAMHFIEELVKNYLQKAYPDSGLPDLEEDADKTGSDFEEDSFSQYYSAKKTGKKERGRPAYQFKGQKLTQDELQIMELKLSAKEVVTKARSYGVSLTVLLAAMFICAIHEEVPHSQKKPISLMIPVNLRNYFPSDSMANFFGWIEVGYQFDDDTVFEDVLFHVKKQFETELTKERIGARMSELVRLEKMPWLRPIPLEIKNVFLQFGATLGGRSITAVFSNVGIIRLPQAYSTYIDRFGILASTDKMQLCSCSYGDTLVLGLTSRRNSDNIQRNLVRQIKKQKLSCVEDKKDYPGYSNKQKETGKKMMQILTFLCIAVSIVCCMINYMIAHTIGWAGFVTAGCLCTWMSVFVGYRKRRNLLKSGIWQLIFVSSACVLWDVFTGWRGWSVDFILPLASLVHLCSMSIVAKVRNLEPEEYLFYLLQASAFGWIPLILLLTGVVRIDYPSIVCIGISFLVFAGLVIFKHRNVAEEFRKKFRL